MPELCGKLTTATPVHKISGLLVARRTTVTARLSGVLRSNRPLDRSCVSVEFRGTDDTACGATLGILDRTESGVTVT